MKLSLFLLVAASLALWAGAATRPHYGGVLRVETRSALGSLDPATLESKDGATERVESLVFETLVAFDDVGGLQPELASGWQHSADYKHWELEIRAGVKLHNGQPLTSSVAAESLRRSLLASGMKIFAESGHVTFENEAPMTNLLAELARPRNVIAARAAGGVLSGTGPFKLISETGAKITLAANDDHWAGRPFLDGIEIAAGRAPRDQIIDLELGNTDVTELELDEVQQMQQLGERVAASQPAELLAIVFTPGNGAGRDERVRRALELSIDRAAICNVLLQRQGEPTAALLPQWMTGYAFLFPSGRDLEQAREQQLKMPSLILDYAFSDATAKAVAERIAVNAREAGIVVQSVGENMAARAGNGDAVITRVRLGSVDTRTALENAAAVLGLQLPEELERARTPEQLYRAEKAMLADHRIIPIAHIPESYGLSGRVKNWAENPAGEWRLEDVWLSGAAEAAGATAQGRR